MIIGHFDYLNLFEKDDYIDRNGCYVGYVHSLWFEHHHVIFEPVRDKHGNGPDFLITSLPSGGDRVECEIGAAWKKTSAKGNAYLAVKLDAPGLIAPVNCALIKQADDDFALAWSREKAEPAPAPAAA